MHAHHPRRLPLQDVLVAVRNKTSLEACEPERRGNEESCLLAPEEAVARFPDDSAAIHVSCHATSEFRSPSPATTSASSGSPSSDRVCGMKP